MQDKFDRLRKDYWVEGPANRKAQFKVVFKNGMFGFKTAACNKKQPKVRFLKHCIRH